MEKLESTIHPLDYLLQGLEASEKIKMFLVPMMEEEERRHKNLQTKLNNMREIVKVN